MRAQAIFGDKQMLRTKGKSLCPLPAAWDTLLPSPHCPQAPWIYRAFRDSLQPPQIYGGPSQLLGSTSRLKSLKTPHRTQMRSMTYMTTWSPEMTPAPASSAEVCRWPVQMKCPQFSKLPGERRRIPSHSHCHPWTQSCRSR
ncbi:hypothetical protein P7K49_039790 [Saguinus oedipus]|uniref:Uncharacterized protein n=1 Tax=Saguinus oedipus TaxID=9490 RepID=A0ABQ9TC49_SAGOE|nr:hypothetical protein P7K49_039790 [Saguinus oedipus]